jgi:hypothetical protein
VKPDDLLATLRAFHREKLTMRERHVAVARFVTDYQFNNAYQYVIAREETHVYWLHRAILDLGGTVPGEQAAPVVAAAAIGEVGAADARANAAFVEKWAPRVKEVSHARHRKMLEVILGEVQEHRRLFEQAAEGRTDIIGIPTAGTQRHGAVLGTRWVE